jgi:hypothetical protein
LNAGVSHSSSGLLLLLILCDATVTNISKVSGAFVASESCVMQEQHLDWLMIVIQFAQIITIQIQQHTHNQLLLL